MEDLSTLKELGIAGVAIGGMIYIIFRLIKELAKNRKDYCSYVNENNHTTTELVRESTATMVSIKDSIENHNKILEKLLDKLN